MLNIRPYVLIALLSFGSIGLFSKTSYAGCEQEERMIHELEKQALLYKTQASACKQESESFKNQANACKQENENLLKRLEVIQELEKQALIRENQVNACTQENESYKNQANDSKQEKARLQQEKEALAKELKETQQALDRMKDNARTNQTNFNISLLGIVLAAGAGLLTGIFLTVKTKNDARQRKA